MNTAPAPYPIGTPGAPWGDVECADRLRAGAPVGKGNWG